MNILKHFSILLSPLFFCFFLQGQSSFFKVVEENLDLNSFPSSYGEGLNINTAGELTLMRYSPPYVASLLRFSATGTPLGNLQIDDNDILPGVGSWRQSSLKIKEDWHVFTIATWAAGAEASQAGLIVANTQTEAVWGKQISANFLGRNNSLINDNEKVFCTTHALIMGHNPLPLIAGLASFNLETGTQEWGYSYKRTANNNDQVSFVDIQEFPNHDLSVIANRHKIQQYSDVSLLRVNEQGEVLQSLDLTTSSLEFFAHRIDAQSNIYLAGRVVGPTGSILHDSDGVIVKLNEDYEVQWAKRLSAEQFHCYKLQIEIFPNGDLMFSYATLGFLPVITGKISTDGDLLWHRGYAFTLPSMAIAADSSIYLSSVNLFAEDGSYEPKTVLAKTDSNGNIAGCPQFEACLFLEDIDVEFIFWPWEREPAPFLPDIEVTATTVPMDTYDTCGVPASPEAIFHLPDTICQYTCLEADSLKNQLANYVEWTISGPEDLDSVIVAPTFEWCFDIPGEYIVEQEIWVLGCSEFYIKRVEVLGEALGLSLGDSVYLCEDMPFRIQPTALRSLRILDWSTGEQSSTITVNFPGEYRLTATDGYCEDSTFVILNSIRDLLTDTPLQLIEDTTLCPDFLPYELHPFSPYSNTFYLNRDTSTTANTFNINQSGKYNISTNIEGCVFNKEFELVIENCAVPIYLPNVFSPNNDGINDLLFPQGEDFEGIRLQIFNRWGDLLFETDQNPFNWDGKSADTALNSEVYLVVFTYFNQRNLKEEIISRDVLLLN